MALALAALVSIFSIGLCAQHLMQIGSAQQGKIPVHLVQASMCFSSGVSSYCFYPFIAPTTFVVITGLSLEATLETISKFVFQQSGHIWVTISILNRYQVTVIRFRPPFIRQLVNYSRLENADLSSIRLVLTSGSYFSSELLAKMAVAIPHKFYLGQSKSYFHI